MSVLRPIRMTLPPGSVVNVSPFWQMAISGTAILVAVVVNARTDRPRGKVILHGAGDERR